MVHNLPTNLTGTGGLFSSLATWASDVTYGIFWLGALAVFCVVMFISSLRYGVERAFSFAGLTAMFGAIILVIMNLISWWMASIFILFGIIMQAVAIVSKRGY